MSLEQDDPLHFALVSLAVTASKLVDDLHDYRHWLRSGDSELFSLQDIERDYRDVTVAWERFRAMMGGGRQRRLPDQHPEETGGP